MERNRTKRNGTERIEIKIISLQNGAERNGMERNGTERIEIRFFSIRNGTKWNGTERNEAKSKLFQFEMDETKENQYFVGTERNELKRNVTNIL